MRSIITTSLAAIVFSAVALSNVAAAATVVVPGTGASFDAPEGFTQLSPSEMAIKFPPDRARSVVVGNKDRGTTIVCDATSEDMQPDQLRATMDAIIPTFERSLPGMEWKQRAVVNIREHQWIYLELTSRATNANIHNILLLTSLRGKFFACNLNSTTDEFPQLEAALRKSIQSIVLPPVGAPPR
jgi:hypothetical protein